MYNVRRGWGRGGDGGFKVEGGEGVR